MLNGRFNHFPSSNKNNSSAILKSVSSLTKVDNVSNAFYYDMVYEILCELKLILI